MICPLGNHHAHQATVSKLISRTPLQYFPVTVRKGLARGARWTLLPYSSYWGDRVVAWPVGIDTDTWNVPTSQKDIDLLIYDKVRWQHERYEAELIEPIKSTLQKQRLRTETIRYGYYEENHFHEMLKRSSAMIFLCEHETTGDRLSTGIVLRCSDPGMGSRRILRDPAYYPHKVQFAPVTSVPYWDDHCGVKFKDISEFPAKLDEFLDGLERNDFSPREYVLENLTLEKCARHYLHSCRTALSVL